ncbi:MULTISPECIES: 4'-phosphopantetheinyl transferase family protein [Curtobacterium]|uniref:4'-phosphopantetheinyl transferase family protein n=1 Tax=Curtobacterium TaxID=2034 RepID=UPI001C649A28|nr:MULTISPECIES: 4'-phosphopantetheinyl transferase superfamily protein [Curtobacterium]MCS6552339.1 4'-phosphopantetheinyl transferase superfamily protein [Curtobacterium flaccumfaciens pv. flaccumfaciens]MDF2808590.1 4-phosphopantetheinyl transferase [Cellulosimicrobium sp.]WIE78516.1 4'-phosphopantetheinyl transferase superfamily protein [Curtobacterium sp. MCSS17_016]
MTGALRGLLPHEVEVEVTTTDEGAESPFAEERVVVSRAVAARRAEFATVRACARRALGRLGAPVGPILPGADRAPRWPEGFVGSLTHCDGFRAAAVARASDVVSLGIDAEPHGPLPDGVEELVALRQERDRLTSLAAGSPDVAWGRVLFSAKESVFKAWSPLTGRWLDFSECELVIQPTGTFDASFLVPGPVVRGRRVDGFDGRWAVQDGLVVTAVCLITG